MTKKVLIRGAVITVCVLGAYAVMTYLAAARDQRRWDEHLDDEWRRFSDLIIPH